MHGSSIPIEHWEGHYEHVLDVVASCRATGTKGMRIAKIVVVSALTCMAGTAVAGEIDRKVMLQLLPCKSAALRMCDRSQGVNAAALWRCGATLAERHNEVGRRCLDVLKQHGQL